MKLRAVRRAALMAVLGLSLAACGGGNIQNAPAPSGGGGQAANCGKLNMAINPWVGYEASAHVVGYVAKSKLGCEVEYKNVKEEVAWQGMGNGEVDVVIENWGHPDLVQKYITDQKTAQDAGVNGNIGIIGWYVPPWMAKEYPDITDWNNLNKYADLFKTTESGGQGQLLDGDPSFVTNDEALVKNLNLNYKVVYAGSEAALIQAFRQAEANKKPLLGYFYDPQWFMSEVPLVKVNLPPYTEAATPIRRRSPATTRSTTSTRSSQPSSSRATARATSWSRRSPGPTRTRTWSRSPSPRTRWTRNRPRRSGSTPTRTRSTPGSRPPRPEIRR